MVCRQFWHGAPQHPYVCHILVSLCFWLRRVHAILGHDCFLCKKEVRLQNSKNAADACLLGALDRETGGFNSPIRPLLLMAVVWEPSRGLPTYKLLTSNTLSSKGSLADGKIFLKVPRRRAHQEGTAQSACPPVGVSAPIQRQ